LLGKNNHRDSENAEVAQRNQTFRATPVWGVETFTPKIRDELVAFIRAIEGAVALSE
jgi:hypothetical protein